MFYSRSDTTKSDQHKTNTYMYRSGSNHKHRTLSPSRSNFIPCALKPFVCHIHDIYEPNSYQNISYTTLTNTAILNLGKTLN